MPFSRIAFFVLFILAILLSGCTISTPDPTPVSLTATSQPAQPSSIAPPSPGATAPPSSTPLSSPTPASASPTPAPFTPTQYTLNATLDYTAHHLSVDEQIHYTNNSTDTLSELVLMVDSLYFPNTFRLNRLEWGDAQPLDTYTWEVGWLRVKLPQSLSPGKTIILSLSFELNLPSPVPSAEYKPIPFGYTARQTNLVDWYPFVAPYVSGKGWLAHQAGYFGEHLVYEDADFKVNIRISDERQDLIIAASAPALKDEDGFHYQLDSARNFAWSISDEYKVISNTVGTVQVLSYFFPFDASGGKAALTATSEALELYSSLYTPYPRATMSVVEADFLDGMEYDGLYFLSKGFFNLYQGDPGSYLYAIAAHETAHQWFYGLVGSDQALEPWLDEALSTYQERIFFEELHPPALDWWWNYRVNFYEPRGWVDRNIYETGGFRPYRDAVYLNGAMFLEDLRKLLGDPVFFGFLKSYVLEYSHKIASTDDFISLLTTQTQTDISPLLKKYFKNRQ